MTDHDAETDAIVAELEAAGLPMPRAVPGAVEAMATMPREACHGAVYEKFPALAAGHMP